MLTTGKGEVEKEAITLLMVGSILVTGSKTRCVVKVGAT